MLDDSPTFFLTIISISPYEVHCQLVNQKKVESLRVEYKKDVYEKYKFIYSQNNHSLLHNLCDYNDVQLKDILIGFIEKHIIPLPVALKEYMPF